MQSIPSRLRGPATGEQRHGHPDWKPSHPAKELREHQRPASCRMTALTTPTARSAGRPGDGTPGRRSTQSVTRRAVGRSEIVKAATADLGSSAGHAQAPETTSWVGRGRTRERHAKDESWLATPVAATRRHTFSRQSAPSVHPRSGSQRDPSRSTRSAYPTSNRRRYAPVLLPAHPAGVGG